MNYNELVNKDSYTLDELIEKYRYLNVEDDWWCEPDIDEWKEKLEEKDYTDSEIQFSGFCSQGSGAGFESGYDIDKFIENNKPLIIQWLFPKITDGIDDLKNYLSIYVKHNGGHYCHYNSFSLHVNIENDPEFITVEKLEEIANYLQEVLEAERKDLCQQIYKSLNDQYDCLKSDEGVKEFLISNDLWEEPEPEAEAEPIRQAA